MISSEEIEAAEVKWNGMTDQEVLAVSREFANEQPALGAYLWSAEELMEEESFDFYLDLFYSIWVAYKEKYKKLKELSIEQIESMDEKDSKLLLEMEEMSEEAMYEETVKRIGSHPQATLIHYIYSSVGSFYNLDDEENSAELSAEELESSGLISGSLVTILNLLEEARELA